MFVRKPYDSIDAFDLQADRITNCFDVDRAEIGRAGRLSLWGVKWSGDGAQSERFRGRRRSAGGWDVGRKAPI